MAGELEKLERQCFNCSYSFPKDKKKHREYLNTLKEDRIVFTSVSYDKYICKRFPPQALSGWGHDPDSVYSWAFPVVEGSNCCAEHKKHLDFVPKVSD